MLDKKDHKLLEALQENAALSTYQLSRKTAIPQTTVLNRIRKLRETGVIKKYTVALNYPALGKLVRALIFVKVNKDKEKKKYGTIGSIEEKLSSHHNVLSVKRIMGKMDLLIEVIVEDVAGLNQFLISKVRSLDEVTDTETMLVLEEWHK